MPSLAQIASSGDRHLDFLRAFSGAYGITESAVDRKRQQAEALLNNAYKQALIDQMKAAQERQAQEAETEAQKVALAQQAAAEKARLAEENRIAKERAEAAKREQESVAPIGGSDSTLFGADTQSAIDKAALGMGPGDIAASAEEIARKQRESAQRIANQQSVMDKRAKVVQGKAGTGGSKEKPADTKEAGAQFDQEVLAARSELRKYTPMARPDGTRGWALKKGDNYEMMPEGFDPLSTFNRRIAQAAIDPNNENSVRSLYIQERTGGTTPAPAPPSKPSPAAKSVTVQDIIKQGGKRQVNKQTGKVRWVMPDGTVYNEG